MVSLVKNRLSILRLCDGQPLGDQLHEPGSAKKYFKAGLVLSTVWQMLHDTCPIAWNIPPSCTPCGDLSDNGGFYGDTCQSSNSDPIESLVTKFLLIQLMLIRFLAQ
jgi:hypothetical protein